MKKYCTKCGQVFESVGREVICPKCKAQAAEETKRAAVLKAKRASWNGESVPVRISGRASTVIRKYGEANSLPFAESLDDLLKSTAFFEKLGVEWSTIVPYKSRRRDKATTETEEAQETPQETPQDKQDGAQASKPQKVTKAKTTNTTSRKKVKA